jgi:hypothetical protein
VKGQSRQKVTRAPKFGGLLMDGEAAARELGVSRRSLERWRLEERGPAWVRVGKLCMYRREDLEAFIARNRVASSEAVA